MRSVQGEMQIPEEGRGSPESLSDRSAARARPPPAESPAMACASCKSFEMSWARAFVADTISSGWYPQIIGLGKGETDKLCGRTCRIFMTGMSRLEITFQRPGEEDK